MNDDLSKLRWNCRRGMLELDALLQPFLERSYAQLPTELQFDFQRLLCCSDLELFRCLLRNEKPADDSLSVILGVIREKHQACHTS
jgi:antitoxin CptB